MEDSFFPLNSAVDPMAPRFSDFGAGWRFSKNFLVQYLFSTDYGFSGSSHTLMVRYTFGLKKEAEAVNAAIGKVLASGSVTADLKPKERPATTEEVGQAVSEGL